MIDDRLLEFTMRIFNTLPNTTIPYRVSSPSSDSDYSPSDTSSYESASSVSTPRSITVPLSFDALDDCMDLQSIFKSNKDEAGILGYDPNDATPTSEYFHLKEREDLHRQQLNRNGWTDLDKLNPRAREFVPYHPASPSVAIIIPSAPPTATTRQSGLPSNPAWYISFIAGSKSQSTDSQLHNSIDIIEAGEWTMDDMADLAQYFCWKGAEANHPYLAFFARILYIKFGEMRGEDIAKSFLWHLRECVVGTFKVCWDPVSFYLHFSSLLLTRTHRTPIKESNRTTTPSLHMSRRRRFSAPSLGTYSQKAFSRPTTPIYVSAFFFDRYPLSRTLTLSIYFSCILCGLRRFNSGQTFP